MATQEIGKPAVRRDAEGASRRQSRRRGELNEGGLAPYLFVAPYLVLFTLFVGIPAVLGIKMSLQQFDYLLVEEPIFSFDPFVGLDNYRALFDSNSSVYADFWQSMRATLLFTVLSVPLLVVIPLFLATMLNQKFKGRTAFRAIYFAPYVLGVAVIAVLFRYILDNNIGLLNYYLEKVGLENNIAWLTAEPWVWFTLVGVTLWWTLGFNTVIYLAGLQDIGKELYEAATVDGANRVRRFWHITLPGLRPVLVFVITITLLASANVFGQPYLMTAGQPANETRTAIYYIAETGLRQYNMGQASSMAFLLAFFLMVFSVVFFLLSRRFND